MKTNKVIQYIENNEYETNLKNVIENTISRIMEKGYSRGQAKKLLACELSAGWNQDSILSGIDTLEERA